MYLGLFHHIVTYLTMVKFPRITSTMWVVATHNLEPSFELRVGLNAMLEAVKFLVIIADLNSGLTESKCTLSFQVRGRRRTLQCFPFFFLFFFK